MIHFTSDNHFGHRNLIHHQPRPEFMINGEPDVDLMDRVMVERWNSKVALADIVYIIGDLGWTKKALRNVLPQLNGQLILIPGNHDRDLLKTEDLRGRFEHIKCYSYYEDHINGQHIIMSHFPIWEWNDIDQGSWHLHGHLHTRPHGISGKIMDVGADGNNLCPYSWDEVEQFMGKKEIRHRHGREPKSRSLSES